MHVVDLLAALSALGLGSAPLCRAAGLNESELRDPGGRIPASFVVGLLAEAQRRTGDSLVGLHAGERTVARGPLIYLVMANLRLEDGLKQVERFGHLPIDTMRMRLTREAANASLRIDLGTQLAGARQLVDYVLAAIVSALRSVVAGLPLREVHVRHAEWSDPAEAVRLFGCPVRCKQPENRLVFPIRALQATSPLGNPLVAAQIEKFTAALSADLAHAATFRERVDGAVRALLHDGRPADRATIARRLHVSRRTLQRRLADERTTFKEVRDATLWEIVDALLSNPSLSVKTVALSVGFSDLAAFSKAFKRRTGYSPTRYRSGATHASRASGRK